MSKRRLGRGLEALLGREDGGYEPATLDLGEQAFLPVDQIDPNPFQPRRRFDSAEIAALADSLRQHGMIQPVLANGRIYCRNSKGSLVCLDVRGTE